MIYLDHAATTPLLPEVKQKLKEVIDLDLGNASALHQSGRISHHFIEDARIEVAKLINANPEEIIFTSGGSEANNTVINIFADKHIAVSAIEHPSVLMAARARAKKVDIIPVDSEGRILLTKAPDYVKLISVMLANNELGTLQPINEIKTNNYLHVDATQAVGKIRIDIKKLNVDYLTFSAHKIGGPLGIGALYVRKDVPYKPLIYGGHQENSRRAGTSNVLAIAGFGEAAKYIRKHVTWQTYAEKIRPLRDQLRARILEEVPYSSINSPEEGCLPNILNVSFRAAEGESIQLYLDAADIEVSTGSACAAGDIQPSHVIMATRHNAEVAHSSIRFSLGLNTTQHDIDEVMQNLPQIIKRLQEISTIKIGD